MHLVFERSNLELVEEGSLTGGDLVINVDNLNWVDDFDLTLYNLGLNVQGLEERGLFGVHTSGTSGDGHISGGNSTDFSGGFSDLGVKNLLDLSEVSVGENHTSVKDELSSDQIEVLAGGNFIGNIFFLEFQNGGSHKGLSNNYVWSVNLRSCP